MSAPLSTELDRPSALAAVLGGAPPSAVTTAGVAAARAELGRSLPNGRPAGGSGAVLRLDRRRFAALRRGPAGLDGIDLPFRCSPARCRRAIGLDALDRCLRNRATSPAIAVAEVLADAEARLVGPGTGHGVPWWAPWWHRQPLGGRAVVQAEAVVWATQVYTGIDWRRAGRRAVVVTRDQRVRVAGAPWCRLEGRADVRVEAESGGAALVVVGSGPAPADWSLDLGFPALVSHLAGGRSAVSLVVGWWPDSGQVRQVRVDDATLVAMAGATAAAASTWWHASVPPEVFGA